MHRGLGHKPRDRQQDVLRSARTSWHTADVGFVVSRPTVSASGPAGRTAGPMGTRQTVRTHSQRHDRTFARVAMHGYAISSHAHGRTEPPVSPKPPETPDGSEGRALSALRAS